MVVTGLSQKDHRQPHHRGPLFYWMPDVGKILPERSDMTTKRVFPLNNPPSEKAAAIALSSRTKQPDSGDRGEDRGVQRGKERVHPVEAIVRCEMCGRWQKIVFAYTKPPQWHRCIGCGELQPMDGYGLTMYGIGLPRVLTDNEITAKKREREGG